VDEKRLFGEIAIQKRYVTVAQVKQALEIQREMRKSGEGHKLIGVLLVELGYLKPEQVVDVLETYDAERAAEYRARPPKDETAADPLLRHLKGGQDKNKT
jgi:hypothetical protein